MELLNVMGKLSFNLLRRTLRSKLILHLITLMLLSLVRRRIRVSNDVYKKMNRICLYRSTAVSYVFFIFYFFGGEGGLCVSFYSMYYMDHKVERIRK